MFLGIEIGGTKLQLGVGPGDGTMLPVQRAMVDPSAGAERIRQQIVELVPALLTRLGLARSAIHAVGIGFGGPVDAERGLVMKSHQIEGWSGFPLADWSRRELGWPTVLQNDADTAGLAEACFGAGRDLSPIFYITIGSGIGGGLIIDQKIYRGSGTGAAEIGHLTIPVIRDSAANRNLHQFEGRTIESICSGWGLERRLRDQIRAIQSDDCTDDRLDRERARDRSTDIDHLLRISGGNLDAVTTNQIRDAACKGNRLAQEHLRETVRVLAWAVSQVITLLNPRRIVIGGGVSGLGDDLLFQPLRDEVASIVFRPFATCYEIVPAALGEAVVVHGALRLARQSYTE